MTALPREESWQEGAHAIHHTDEVHFDRQAVILGGHLVTGPWQTDPGIVDQDVDRTPLLFGVVDDFLPSREVAYVEDGRLDTGEPFAKPGKRFDVDVDRNHTVARLDAKPRNGGADAMGCAGDEGSLRRFVRCCLAHAHGPHLYIFSKSLSAIRSGRAPNMRAAVRAPLGTK